MITMESPDLPGALCAGRYPWWDLDVSGESDEARTERHTAAIRVCQRCPVKKACREWGERMPRARYGVWGGRLHIERVNTKPRRRPERPATGPARPTPGRRTPDAPTAA